ncbi:hypothetical protein X801_04457 [Opisthorchis viverrini]|uniref:Uncharacterized protein n=1 Tax=Opisthorchis viverrini TaxID=6198 RepID=A0A1S8WZ33_OPIVI|nr:hypothetical protein X801_04457 [Opisthorchis viverrini]
MDKLSFAVLNDIQRRFSNVNAKSSLTPHSRGLMENTGLYHQLSQMEYNGNAFILLEKMHMDLANFTIAQMRPYIRQQAVQYERSKFATFLDAQKDCIQKVQNGPHR